jgi:hypothetical protein
MMNDLCLSLVEHFDLPVNVYQDGSKKYLDAETLAEVEYISDGDVKLPDGTTLKIHRMAEDYSDIDPDCNPMGFVVEFNKPGHGPRWLEVYGHYVSHDGGYYDGWREVAPKTVTVKTFEGI